MTTTIFACETLDENRPKRPEWPALDKSDDVEPSCAFHQNVKAAIT